jgi:2-(1,2-epoxy-1,2-dihydrophenyl)acetyl-CoA isomerase
LTAEEYNTLEFEVRDGVAHVTLSRPEVGNALNLELAQELLRAVMRCDEEQEVRAVVLAGAGRMFCVGGDLRSLPSKESSSPTT